MEEDEGIKVEHGEWYLPGCLCMTWCGCEVETALIGTRLSSGWTTCTASSLPFPSASVPATASSSATNHQQIISNLRMQFKGKASQTQHHMFALQANDIVLATFFSQPWHMRGVTVLGYPCTPGSLAGEEEESRHFCPCGDFSQTLLSGCTRQTTIGLWPMQQMNWPTTMTSFVLSSPSTWISVASIPS